MLGVKLLSLLHQNFLAKFSYPAHFTFEEFMLCDRAPERLSQGFFQPVAWSFVEKSRNYIDFNELNILCWSLNG